MKYSYYPGCTLRNKAKDLDEYARASARALGFELEEIEDWQCCGGVYPLGTDEIATKLSSVRALNQAKEKGQDLVTICSACHHVIKRVNDDMKKWRISAPEQIITCSLTSLMLARQQYSIIWKCFATELALTS